MPSLIVAVLAAGAAMLAAARAGAQAAPSLILDPSVRSAGMGGASSAVLWSGDVNAWANPAMLGYARGLRYRWTKHELVPDLAPDVRFRTHSFSYGWGGVGLAVERKKLSYGRIELTNAQGVPIGTYEPTEHVRPLSAGISLSRTLETVASLRGRAAPPFVRYADVAIGLSRNPVNVRLAPGFFQGEASTVASDFGLLVRATPTPWTDTGGWILDLTYGFALLNYNDAKIVFIDAGRPAYVLTQHRHGIAARVAVPASQGMAADLERSFGHWIAAGMDPLVSVAVAADFARNRLGPERTFAYGVEHLGVELAIANSLAVRLGHVRDDDGRINSYSFGLGFGFSLAEFAGARYDYARYPQATGFMKRESHGVAAWFDPVAFVRR